MPDTARNAAIFGNSITAPAAKNAGRRAVVGAGGKRLASQRVETRCRILDGVGPGQYGPPGFEAAGVSLLRVSGHMSDGTRGNDGDPRNAEEAALSARLRTLGERLDQVGSRRQVESGSAPRPGADMSAFARGMRLSAELVGGVVIGFILGWVLDRWFGTTPWGLIIFLLLGFSAGVLNVMRSAGVAGPTDASRRK
jgi:ATP synthase protein I